VAEGSAAKPPILVSACLLGVACNHRGAASPSAAVIALADERRVIAVCPETMGGLPTPRPAAERQPDGRVVTADGVDVTDAYRRGADATVALAAATGATEAILKSRSPSCGVGQVYDGTFSRTLVAGDGVTAVALRSAGVDVRTDEEPA
jgi:uncharacterized protein YbbK (DUF523 family)